MATILVSASPPCSCLQGSTSCSFELESLINQLKFSKSIEEVKQIHAHVTRSGLSQYHSVSTKLVSAYSRGATPKSLDYAIRSFELLDEEDKASPFLWNSLIRGFCSAGYVDDAIELYVQMLDEGLFPDRFTFPPLLAVCTKALVFPEGYQLHGFLLKAGSCGEVQDDIFIHNSLIHFYAEQGNIESAVKVFEGMRERNVVSWTSLIDGYARGDDPLKAVTSFFDMVAESKVAPNCVTVACVVSACAKLHDLESGERILAYAADSGIEFSIPLLNTLVDMYMKCGAVEVAERLFHESTRRNLVLWNTMLSNYTRRGMPEKAIALFNDMLILGPRPDRATVVAAAAAATQLGEAMVGRRFHGYILRNSLDGLWDVGNSILDTYMKCGEPDAAFRVFDQMTEKNIVSWNIIIAGCIRNGDLVSAWKHFKAMPTRDRVSWNTMIGALLQESWFEAAISLFREMLHSGMRPDKVTIISVASACGYLCALDLAKWTYAYVNKSKIPTDVKLNTAFVDMFARCGDTKAAIAVFDEMRNRDVSSWTAAIGATAAEGNGRRAMELYSEMLKKGINPDSVLFVQLLTACSHGGLVEEGREVFESMTKDYGIAPKVIHYGCMVDLLGRAGHLDEALALIKSMPIEPNDVVWGALLAASCVHHNLELAQFAAKKVLELEPHRSGIHVLLSNLYASEQRWKDVAEVRLSLKDKGVRKLPGCSLIEVNGMVHEFTSSDDSHPQMKLIAAMLQEMGHKLLAAGHVPNFDNVLLDVDEKEKEYHLNRHSEKTAVAFGLISTSQGVPVRVVKNLRMCVDCHSFMKLVSVIYDREISIRDNSRFHRFKQGKCSCNEYW